MREPESLEETQKDPREAGLSALQVGRLEKKLYFYCGRPLSRCCGLPSGLDCCCGAGLDWGWGAGLDSG